MTKEQKQFTSINIVGRISATSNKVSEDFKQETPTKTVYIVPKDKKEIEKLEKFGLPLYTPKEKGSESYTIVKSAKTVKHYKSVKDEAPQKMIMIVEDEKVIRDAVVSELEKWNYEVVAVEDFSQVYTQFLSVNPQLVILDITLPFFNGYYWCQEIRKVSQVPIMFLSSHDQPMDIVMSINMGADDYMTKPFEPSVLVAKIQGMMRRSYEFVQQKDWIEYKGATLQLASTKVSFNGEEMDLSKNELIVLRVLFEKQGDIATREELMNQLWNSDLFVDDNTLSVTVARLRKKLAEIGLANLITTKKGIGYGMAEEIQ